MTSETSEIDEISQKFFASMGFCRNPDRLVKNGLSVIDTKGRTALHLAAANGNKRFVEDLIENGANVNFKDNKSRTPLFYAVESSDKSITRLLLRHGANPNTQDKSGSTPLDAIVKSSESNPEISVEQVELVELLLRYGANPNIRSKRHQYSPLVFALLNDLKEIIELFGEHRDTVFQCHRDDQGRLHSTNGPALETEFGVTIYAIHGDFKSQRIVESNKVISLNNARSNRDFSPRQSKGAKGEIVDYPSRPEIFKRDLLGHPKFIEAIRMGGRTVFDRLLAEGADVNQRTWLNRTPLMIAATHNNNPYIVDRLLDAGADVNARDDNGTTALHNASFYLRPNASDEIIESLLEAGADVNAQDDYGHNAVMGALVSHEKPTIIKKFLNAGADLTLEGCKGTKAYEWIRHNTSLKENYPDFYDRILNWG